jgi:hypothetical protein
MIEFIGNAANPIKTADDTVRLFHDSCFGFAALGMRFDLLYHKISGSPDPAEDVQLSHAMRKDVNLNSTRLGRVFSFDDVFDSIPGELLGPSFDNIDTLIHNAYSGSKCFATDSQTLMAIYLLHFLQRTNKKMELNHLSCFFAHNSCAAYVNSNSWKNRAVIGYFETGEVSEWTNDYINKLNLPFVQIFTSKIETLLLSGTPDDYATASLRNTLYDVIVKSYFGDESDALRTYHDISALLDVYDRKEIITEKHIYARGYHSYAGREIVSPKYDIENGETYEINRAGLVQFCELVEAFNLGDMPGFEQIASRIRAL